MILKSSTTVALVAAATMSFAASLTAHADTPGRHPGFLHALTDLRSARWLIMHRQGDAKVSAHEDAAVQDIVAAISDIQRAAIDDGKALDDHPAMDAPPSREGRLKRAQELLTAAHHDINQRDDDPATFELKKVALKNVQAATHEVDGALWDAANGR